MELPRCFQRRKGERTRRREQCDLRIKQLFVHSVRIRSFASNQSNNDTTQLVLGYKVHGWLLHRRGSDVKEKPTGSNVCIQRIKNMPVCNQLLHTQPLPDCPSQHAKLSSLPPRRSSQLQLGLAQTCSPHLCPGNSARSQSPCRLPGLPPGTVLSTSAPGACSPPDLCLFAWILSQ